MTHYLTRESCKIEKKHYSIIIRFVNAWEENFWNDNKPEQKILSDPAKFFIGISLFKAFNEIAANTIDRLYDQELAGINPLLAWNTGLATNEMKEKAEYSLLEKLEQNTQTLFDTSPMLEDNFKLCERQFGGMITEMLVRINADRQKISSAFFGKPDFGKVIKIDGGQGDKHQWGRCAMIITTELGKFLYKPRNMKADTVLYDMVSEMFSDTVVLPKTLDFGQYGYAEFIASEPAGTTEEAERFFSRLGGVCALFRTFASTDFHCENILAKGEFPAIVDLETFLGVPGSADTDIPDGFQRDLNKSLFRSGFLPKRSNEHELSPLLCKDENSILPVIDGKRVDVRSYLTSFDDGFRKIYHRCIDERSALLQYLGRFSKCRFRCLLRNTNDYAKLLQGLYSVKVLSSEKYRSERINALKNALSGTGDDQEKQSAVAEEELTSLLRGDVPIFHCIADSRNLYSGEKLIIQDYFSVSIAENVRSHIDDLTERECEFELGMIHQSLRCAHIPGGSRSPKAAQKSPSRSFTDEAGKVFDEIWKQRLVSPSGTAGWLDHVTDGNHFGYLPLTYGMGESGIAAFAAEYYAVTGDARAEQVVRDFMDKFTMLVSQLKSRGNIESLSSLLGTLNISGTVKAALMAGKAMNSREYIQKAVEAVELLSGISTEKITLADFYSGLSGWLYLLCSNEEIKAAAHYKEYIISLCDRILEMQTLNTPRGIPTWDTLGKKRPISGLGHGIAGIGTALACAYRLFPSDKLRSAIRDAFETERALYSDRLATWPDYRDTSAPASAMNGYCSGAPGMGSAYLKLHTWGITDFDEDMEKAIIKVSSTGIMPRDHYCCGNSASIEFLIDAGRELDRPDLSEAALRRMAEVVKRKETRGEYTFLPEQYENYSPPGLLNGLSGIGHTLLKADNSSISGLFL